MQTQTLRHRGIVSQLQEQIVASNTDEEVQRPATNVTHTTIIKISWKCMGSSFQDSHHHQSRFVGG